MNVVRFGPDPVACKYCDAKMAEPHGNRFGMCFTCNHAFRVWSGYKDNPSDDDALAFLARNLRIAAVKVAKGLPVGRCECLALGHMRRAKGEWYQCGSQATLIVDGLKMCGTHARRYKNGEAKLMQGIQPSDPSTAAYSWFLKPLSELAKADPKFRQAVMEAMQ